MKNLFPLFLLLLFTDACVDRLEFEAGENNLDEIVIEGVITDQPGPYQVKLSRSVNIDEVINFAPPVNAKKVMIFDSEGTAETLTNLGDDIFETNAGGIRGIVGRAYHLRVELNDGRVFESIPDELRPGGEIDSLYWQFDSSKPISGPTVNGFRIFANARNLAGKEQFVRWKYTGISQVETFPELFDNCPCRDCGAFPRPCSGKEIRGGATVTIGPCTCCTCWVYVPEIKPRVNDNSLVVNGEFKNIELDFVEINPLNFFSNKFLVKVEQMSLSKTAFEFWKTIQDQKEGLTSLFQPAFGKAKTNLFEINGKGGVQGIFYASSVSQKHLFITAKDVLPLSIPQFDCVIEESCLLFFPNSTNVKPPEWN